jgi:hypothetical protein
MSPPARAATVLLVLLGLAAPPLAAGDTLIGTWELAKQTYGEGGYDFEERAAPLHLVFATAAGAPEGRLRWAGEERPWPAYPTPDGFAPVDQVQVAWSPDLRSVRATYRVLPPPGDDTSLRVEERYELDAAGRLAGAMTVTLERDGRPRGSFTWQRLLEREGDR